MTRIWVINPNTTEPMTIKIEACARAVAAPGVSVTGVTSEIGPPSIESHYDEAMSVPGVLAAIRRGEVEGVDGYVIACFGDPGLDAAREAATRTGDRYRRGSDAHGQPSGSRLLRGHHACTHYRAAADLAERYGMQRFCRGVHACEIPVLDLDTDPDALKIVTEACREAVETDGSEVVVLGCAGMADMWAPHLDGDRRPGGRRCHGRDADRAVAGRHGLAHVEAGGVRRASTEGLHSAG